MASIFIPTKSQITSYKANPAQLLKDKESEDYFASTDNYQFLRALTNAMRKGQASVTYTTTTTNANAIKTFLTDAAYGYGFATGDIVISPDSSRPTEATLVLSWTYA